MGSTAARSRSSNEAIFQRWREWSHKTAQSCVQLSTLPGQNAWEAAQPATLKQGVRQAGLNCLQSKACGPVRPENLGGGLA